MNKKTNECFMCSSKCCYEHVYSCDDDGKAFNEIACRKHVKQLYALADELKDVMKYFISSTGKSDRRDRVEEIK